MTASSHGGLYAAWAQACCTTFADASNKCVSHFVGEMEVAGCKQELADAEGVGAHVQQGHAPWQPALWWVSMQFSMYSMSKFECSCCNIFSPVCQQQTMLHCCCWHYNFFTE